MWHHPASFFTGWLLICGLLLQGCASYSHSFYPIEQKLSRQDPAGALLELEKQGYASGDQLLYLFNKAMLQRMQADFAGSNQTLEKAKRIIQRYAATSITEESAAFMVNDATRTYIGTPLEQVMLHVYAALNYLELGDHDAARVEILQVDVRLRQLMSDAPNSALSVDPFARYLAGMIFEDLGEYSDAMIAYRKAYQAYQLHNSKLYALAIPPALKRDLLRMARRVGLWDEYRKLRQRFAIAEEEITAAPAGEGEIVLILHNGLAPLKREHDVAVVDPGSGRLIRVSLPYYQDRSNRVRGARLIAGKASQTTETVEHIDAIDHKTLEAYMPAITARAIARAVVKYNMAREAGKQDQLAGVLVNIAGFVVERADTRSWLTLPAKIQMARLRLKAGRYNLSLELLDASGRPVRSVKLGEIDLPKGKRRYISYHYIPPYAQRY